MKQLLSMVVIAGTVAIITFSSCAKEVPWSPSALISQAGNPAPANQPSANFELVANNWVNSGGQLYTNTFKGVIATANASGNHAVTVYLQENGQQTQISQRRITYMGNELWAINSQADVSIIYRCSGKLPFTSLNIRVQVN
jgi:hypothetical protein